MASESEMNSQSTTKPDSAEGVDQPERRRMKKIAIPQALIVGELATILGASAIEVIKQLMRNGMMATVNQVLDFQAAAVVCRDFGFEPTQLEEKTVSTREDSGIETGTLDELASLSPRPPVVTILGHVDHGKTTLLDAIRESRLVDREAGNITQHMGAYQVERGNQIVTFIDTPGHEAFTAMRARGAQITDIVVLVVAADDGVMPQTVEAIHHAKAANVPIVVAVNKVDKPEADIERVKRQLAEQDLLIEEWGGEVIAIATSAKEGLGIGDLLDNILVVAEVAELRANGSGNGKAVVIDARVDPGRGVVATVLVKSGVIKEGDRIVSGETRGGVKALFTDVGDRVKSAGPSTPIEILGLSDLPQPGDFVEVTSDDHTARVIVAERRRNREASGGIKLGVIEERYAKIRAGDSDDLNVILKTDVQGTLDAIALSLDQLSTDKTKVNMVRGASGSISEGDVLLAVASKAVIVSFGARTEQGARMLAEKEGIEIRQYSIIYRLLEDIEATLKGMVEPEMQFVTDGRSEVRAIFSIGRSHKIAGIYVTDGKVLRGSMIRVLRSGKIIHDGPIRSLRHLKNDVRELGTGTEGGVGLEDFDDFEEGDILDVYHIGRVG